MIEQPPPVTSMDAEFSRLRRRLREAHRSGRGVNLSAREVQLLGLGVLAEWWSTPDSEMDQPVRHD